MCLATVLSVGGAITSAIGTLSSGMAASANANYQAQVARNNAQIAQQNADYARKAGQAQAQKESLKSAYRAGEIKAAQAANGIDVNTGTNVDVQVGDREKGKLDTETVLHNADLQAYGYRTQAVNFEAEAGLQEAKAGQAQIGGFLGAAGGLLGNTSFTGLFKR